MGSVTAHPSEKKWMIVLVLNVLQAFWKSTEVLPETIMKDEELSLS
jgi:hypothetical protein